MTLMVVASAEEAGETIRDFVARAEAAATSEPTDNSGSDARPRGRQRPAGPISRSPSRLPRGAPGRRLRPSGTGDFWLGLRRPARRLPARCRPTGQQRRHLVAQPAQLFEFRLKSRHARVVDARRSGRLVLLQALDLCAERSHLGVSRLDGTGELLHVGRDVARHPTGRGPCHAHIADPALVLVERHLVAWPRSSEEPEDVAEERSRSSGSSAPRSTRTPRSMRRVPRRRSAGRRGWLCAWQARSSCREASGARRGRGPGRDRGPCLDVLDLGGDIDVPGGIHVLARDGVADGGRAARRVLVVLGPSGVRTGRAGRRSRTLRPPSG